MACPFACTTAQRTISSADLSRKSALAWDICSGVMGRRWRDLVRHKCGRSLVRRRSLLLPQHALDPVAEALACAALLGVAREQRAQLILDLGVFQHVFPDAIEA